MKRRIIIIASRIDEESNAWDALMAQIANVITARESGEWTKYETELQLLDPLIQEWNERHHEQLMSLFPGLSPTEATHPR